MKLATRLEKIEAKLRPDDDVPRLRIVLEDEDGVWHDGQGHEIDLATVGPLTRVVRLIRRPDGPQ